MAGTGTMQAAILDGLKLPFRVKSVERPKPASGQVLVRITASGVIPLDLKIRAGEAAHARRPLPAISVRHRPSFRASKAGISNCLRRE
jgi:NADPH2:quinone reductase